MWRHLVGNNTNGSLVIAAEFALLKFSFCVGSSRLIKTLSEGATRNKQFQCIC